MSMKTTPVDPGYVHPGDIIVVPETFVRSPSTCQAHGLSVHSDDGLTSTCSRSVARIIFGGDGPSGDRLLLVTDIVEKAVTTSDRLRQFVGNLIKPRGADIGRGTAGVTVSLIPVSLLRGIKDGSYDMNLLNHVLADRRLFRSIEKRLAGRVTMGDIQGAALPGGYSAKPGDKTSPDVLMYRLLSTLPSPGAPVSQNVSAGRMPCRADGQTLPSSDEYATQHELEFLFAPFTAAEGPWSPRVFFPSPPYIYHMRERFLAYLAANGCRFVRSPELKDKILDILAQPLVERAAKGQKARTKTLVDTRKSLEAAIKVSRRRDARWSRLDSALRSRSVDIIADTVGKIIKKEA